MKTRAPVPTALVLALSTVLAGVVAAPAAAQEDSKPRIAVVDFRNTSRGYYTGARLGKAAADELTTQLVKAGDFTVVERSRLQSLIAEQDLGQSGRVDAGTAAKIGQLLGVQGIVTGSITQFSIETKSGGIGPVSASYSNAESKLDLRVVDTSTGEILLAAVGEGSKKFGGARFEDVSFRDNFNAGLAQEALRPAVMSAVEKITELKSELASIEPKAPPGKVVGVSGEDYYINRGKNFGVEAGQRFEIYRVVDEIRNADGELLDTVTEKVGELEVERVLSKSSICRVVSGDAKKGDEVRGQDGGG